MRNQLFETDNSKASALSRILLLAGLVALLFGLLAKTTPVYAQSAPGISSPSTGSSISGDVPILGTAVIEPFSKYELHYKLEPSGDDSYIYFDGNTSPVVNGQMAVWRASGLPAGVYSLRLRVVKNDGNYAEYFARNLNVNQGPAATPTSDEPTPTPIPTVTFTPAPQPTPAIGEVAQPEGLEIALPTPTPVEPVAAAVPASEDTGSAEVSAGGEGAAPEEVGGTSVTRELGEALSLTRLQERFASGMRLSAILFLIIGLIFGGKQLFIWLRRR